MITKEERAAELRLLLRRVMRGLWARRRPTPELLELVEGASLSRRHVALLAQVGSDGERSVGELARELGLSLPAASTLARELADHGLLERR
ncbi:MAG: MarR family transcriptional regulator, partial [Gaiellaceae bacterium]